MKERTLIRGLIYTILIWTVVFAVLSMDMDSSGYHSTNDVNAGFIVIASLGIIGMAIKKDSYEKR